MTTPPEELTTGRETGFGRWTTREPAGPPYCKDDELDYSNWYNNEPNNAYGGENCVEFRSYTTSTDGGVWSDRRCSYYRYYLCEKGKKCSLRIERFFFFYQNGFELPICFLPTQWFNNIEFDKVVFPWYKYLVIL